MSHNHHLYLDYLGTRENAYESYNEDRVANRMKSGKENSKGGRRRYYPSNVPQSFICNAATGVAYPYKVGSKEQSFLYKIVDTTGTCDANGSAIRRYTETSDAEGNSVKTQSILPNSNTNHLFFDSPEQCMAHLQVTIQPADVARWHETHRSMEHM